MRAKTININEEEQQDFSIEKGRFYWKSERGLPHVIQISDDENEHSKWGKNI